MQRLWCLGICFAVLLSVPQVGAAPLRGPAGTGFHPVAHPIQTLRAVWQRERALRALERVVQAKPRLAVKYQERYGRISGGKQFTSRGPVAMLGIGTAVNIGGFIQSDQLIPYLILGAAVDLSAFATHMVGTGRLRRKTIISLIEDHTISDTDLKPFRDALGLSAKGRHLGHK